MHGHDGVRSPLQGAGQPLAPGRRGRPPALILGISLHYWGPFHGWAQPRAIDPNRLDNHPAYALVAKLGERLEKETS